MKESRQELLRILYSTMNYKAFIKSGKIHIYISEATKAFNEHSLQKFAELVGSVPVSTVMRHMGIVISKELP